MHDSAPDKLPDPSLPQPSPDESLADDATELPPRQYDPGRYPDTEAIPAFDDIVDPDDPPGFVTTDE